MNNVDVDVLVVGAGPVGLAAAVELGLRGFRVLVAERNTRAGMAPRAKTTNVRTRTHLRRWGIADRLAAESPFGIDYPGNMVFVTRLTGYELARFENAFNVSPERSPLYPEHGQWIPQYKLEKVLLEKVRDLPGVQTRFDTSFVSATQTPAQLTARLQSPSGELQVTAHYLIGADGARSAVRSIIGAKMQGRHGLLHSHNIIFTAPGLSQALRHGPASIYWQLSPDGFSAVGPMDVNDTWFFMPGGFPPGETLSETEAAALIARRTGVDLPYRILSADTWTASALLADRYSDGRIFLAGDACHLHPPFGGYGMNMGIGDAVDLGWKMAATLQGWGGPRLLDSYEVERRQVHQAVIEEAVANQAMVGAAIPSEIENATREGEAIRAKVGAGIRATKSREFSTLGTVLGLGYEGSPIVAREPGSPPPRDAQHYTPTARPGYLAPHAWLPDGRSLYDIFGAGFTLIASQRADEAEVAAAVEDARRLRVPLTVVRSPEVPIDELYEAALTLVRPDQHVAWRGVRWTGALAFATGRDAWQPE